MNRKFIILGFFALIALTVILISARKRAAPANQAVVITPDGKMTVVPHPDSWTITMDKPLSKTNTSGALTNSNSK